jgi:thiosulfate/3-mercaptopyruvate sulfurtransferase
MEVVMRLLRSIAGPLALLLIAAAPAAAAPRDGLIVTTAWLAQHLADPDLVLLHVGDKAEYDARHIPGARFVALSDISVTGPAGKGLTLEMPPAADLRERLANLGISDRSRIVVYYGKDWVSPTTRVIFTLDYAGLGGATSLLDGGMDAWTRDGHDVTAVVPPARRGTLSAREPRSLIVDAEYVLAHLETPQTAIVDARDTTFYDGTQTGGRGDARHRTGHIAGAHSVPFSSLTDDKLRVKPTEELAAIFERAGVQPHDTVVAYCHIGQQATAVIFAARVLGHPVWLYDGSFEDWSRHPNYPVEVPAKRDGGR